MAEQAKHERDKEFCSLLILIESNFQLCSKKKSLKYTCATFY